MASFDPDHLLWTARDYREFLARWLEMERVDRPALSIRNLGRKLAMDSSLLGKILQGERHLATSRIQPICDLIGLKGERAEYFRHMVLFAKSKTAREAQACFARMRDLRRIAPLPLRENQETYWDRWENVAIRSLLSCGDFGDEWDRMGDMLHPRQDGTTVRTAIKALERLGMAAKNAEGFWKPTEPFVRDRVGVPGRSLRNFHRQSLLLAVDALEGLPPDRRDISSVAVSVDEPAYRDIVEFIQDLRSKVLTRAAQVQAPSRVVQVNFQIVPLTTATPASPEPV